MTAGPQLQVLPGEPPVVAEFVESSFDVVRAKRRVGTGSFHLTRLSDRDPQHKLPVVEQLEAALYTDALVTLAATRTSPVK
ncbi:hypothetical protein [Streptomyces flaveus]|uniref:hypothetical protein n=1 Tax=Streptomyces flaveus TaxID=66370 RepID=UPI003319D719